MTLSLLAPAALAAGLSLAIIYVLHIRRQTPPSRRMSSLRFWSAADASVTDRQRFQLPPLSLALLLQLLIAAIVTLTLARPALSGSFASIGDTSQPEHTIVILDGSTSMQATGTDNTRTRWDEGRDDALDVVGSWQPGDVVSVLIVGNAVNSRTASNETQRNALRSWLTHLTPPGGRANIDDALQTASNLNLPDRRNRIVVITDGAIYPSADIVRRVGMPIEIRTAGGQSSTDNGAITSIGARQIAGSTRQFAVAFEITNFSSVDADIPWSTTADGEEVASNTLFLAPGEARLVTVNLPVDTLETSTRLMYDDALPIDNVATVAIGGTDSGSRRILLLSDSPSDLLRALQAIPGARVEVYSPSTPGLIGLASGFDLLVTEGYAPPPDERPSLPALLIQPAANGADVIIEGASSDPALTYVDAQAPELVDVDLSGVTWGTIPVYRIADDAKTLASVTSGTRQTPLIWEGVQGDDPWIATSFAVAETNIASRVAFPIMISRMVESLMRDTVPRAITSGDALPIPATTDVDSIVVEKPDGTSTTLVATSGSNTVFSDTGLAGQYTISQRRPDGSEQSSLTMFANAGDPVESDLTINRTLDELVSLPSTEASSSMESTATSGEIWRLLTLLLLGILLVEWLTSSRSGWRRRSHQVTS